MTGPPTSVSEIMAPGIRRLIAPNPGPMTNWGTNTYIVGSRSLVVIDPGPDLDTHLDALLAAIGDAQVTHILVTHAHLDHSALAPRLAAATGAPVAAFGLPDAGRSDRMQALAAKGLTGGGEGVDHHFAPDITLADGDRIEDALDVLHTPGHFAGHLAFRYGDTLLSGDHVMGWSTTLISPPDGDVSAFMASTRALQGTGLAMLLPGHGAPITDPDRRLAELIAHREAREAQILTALVRGPATLETLTADIYTDIAPALLPAAARNVFAHLVDLKDRKFILAAPELSETALFSRA